MAVRAFKIYGAGFKGPSPSVESSAEMQAHVARLVRSFARLTGGKSLPVLQEAKNLDDAEIWRRLHYDESVALLSTGPQEDPILNYGNLGAQKLFEVNWEELTSLPGRLTAGPMERQERQDFLDRVSKYGFVTDYSGIRTSAKGRKFRIVNANVWNVLPDEDDTDSSKLGQAAFFSTDVTRVDED
ncbi:Hypothetical Protein FCC1311_109122 [Hondaea fermentalgiana]|uniref:MEKHLA domain-containing protein n=1 Tax=Hondaea fermentalgiana TaxID=2315210 RepID=A0A2R5GV17_9STRA|nr:Hypothetical Protein FCC1311_109122 [Hondaea fermentalgiana]|eukprot:GBG34690.1 Hypothetical Protein FCC1311_109122 [Hondaea fermentalgiana]